jgi:hypothetical protein
MRLADATDPAASLDGCGYYGPCSAYVWLFYLPLVGLSAMGCYCYLTALVEQGCSEIRWQDMATALNMQGRGQVVDALVVLESAEMVDLSGGACGIKRRLPILDIALEAELPPRLRQIHTQARKLIPQGREAGAVAEAPSPVEAMRERARMAAVALLRMGRSYEEIESELAASGFHPSLVASSILWALWHLVASASDRLPVLSSLLPLRRTTAIAQPCGNTPQSRAASYLRARR